MSVTVSDLLKLPSLQHARVIGGAGGLKKVVSSISVLESTDPGVLINEVFRHNKYPGSEIVITGFLNCINDVECQCSNLLRLIEGGEVGMVLYYVGVYLPRVNRRLIEIADANDFVLICMPEGQRHLRYSDLITDVTECIYKDSPGPGLPCVGHSCTDLLGAAPPADGGDRAANAVRGAWVLRGTDHP